MVPTKQDISDLLKFRARYAHNYGLNNSRRLYNPIIRYHIWGLKNQQHTLKDQFQW